MIPLSQAILRGQGSDPLDSALSYVSRDPGAATSHDAECRQRIAGLHRAFPHIGESVRRWPKLAEELEELGVLAKYRSVTQQHGYRPEVHMSVWKCITELYDGAQQGSKERVAESLARAGL
jgi:hypothetical protein